MGVALSSAPGGVEACDIVLDRERRADCVIGAGEGGHHRIAHGLDDEAVIALHPVRQERKMVANEVVSGGVAERIVEFGRALEVGEHDGDPADLGIVARTQQLLRGEPTEGGHGDHPLAGQRVAGPIAVLDDEDERPVALVADRKLIPAVRSFKQNLAAARHERRDDAVGADVAINFAARLDGPKTVRPRRQGEIKGLGRLRRNLALKLDVPRRARAEHAHLPVRQRTNPRLGMEGQLDVAAEIALVVDVAGGAMRAFRQFLKSAHAGLRAAAARA